MDGWDFTEETGPSSINEKFSNGSTRMEFDDEVDFGYSDSEDEFGLISHQINSYNDFVKHGIQRVFDSVGEIMIEPGYDPTKRGDGEWKRATLKFGKVTLDHPTFWTGEKFSSTDGAKEFLELLPRHAHLQNMTYSSRIKVETHLQVYTESPSRSDKFKTGVDIVVEKTILNIRLKLTLGDFLSWSKYALKGCSKDPIWTIAYRPVSKRTRVYIKLVPKVEHLKAGDKILTVYFYVTEIPIWLLFFALGVPNDREVVKLIGLDTEENSTIANILMPSIHNADKKFEGFRKAGNAVGHIMKLMQGSKFPPTESLEALIHTYLFPNLRSRLQKASFLAYMVKCLLDAYRGRRKVDNRDDFRNKRVELAGELLERELAVHIKHAERRMVKAIQRDLYKDREVQSIDHYLDASIITNGLSRAFSTGAWVHPYKRMERLSGVVANLRRTNSLQAVCDMRRIRQQVSYTGRVGDARYPHPSHWGKVCFLSTPDGENCGLVKNLASLGLVSNNMLGRERILKKFLECGMENLVDDDCCLLSGRHKVFLDGDWVGVCKDSSSFVAKLRHKRRKMEVPQQIEIKRDKHQHEVRIFADAGRILRPLFVVQNLKKIKDLKGDFLFQSLLDNGIVEFIGPEEEEDCQTAWGIDYMFTAELDNPPVKYTHCEFDSSFLLGLSCGIVPFANHDHARRVLYQSAKHSQQAIGYSTTNPNIRVDTNSHQLYYPQRPLFRTMLSDCLGKSRYSEHHKGMMPQPDFFNGQSAIVAVNVHLGYNQEDSLVMNRASLERGVRTEHVRSYKAEQVGRVDSLDDDSFPFIGANLQTGDIVIGKYAASGVDHSIKLKHTERGMVQKVVLSANDEGKNFAVVSLRQVRSPCLGDKFSSMHGQKGVLGFLESQENFPFTVQGIVPDIVINPHAFPSRQMPGQLLEAALGKGIALGGGLKYATPFSTPSVEDITSQLHRLGYSRWGGERMYDGRTGEKVETLIFMGPTFYQRLTHMAEDKVKFRNTGPVHPLTRQPVADRKRFGGIKFGEMERDCLIAHGAAANLHERLFTPSDSSQMHICRKCKNVVGVIQRTVVGGRRVRGPYCRFCEAVEDVVRVNVPYGAKLELFSMGISLKFETELC
ncbi:hypothetical protein SASPL_150109 [Salvia splendens]|uniref:DNA-directed RNA polymerase subunit beta n=1 Tax=Salvia splendens TaxID=180675 RepID=A0A8X8Z1G3_SALSN|nr:hypothetical protein SASPL_150109 [Salvia splendens]